MARLDVPEGDGLEASRIWKLAPNLRDGVTAMSQAIYERSSLPIREREVARMRIAQLNQCHVWLNTRAASAMQQGLDDELYNQVQTYVTNDAFSDREKLAIEYAEQFAIDHTMVGEDLWARLQEHFSDQEVMELTMTNAFCLGFGRAYQVLDIDVDFDVLWSREPDCTHN